MMRDVQNFITNRKVTILTICFVTMLILKKFTTNMKVPRMNLFRKEIILQLHTSTNLINFISLVLDKMPRCSDNLKPEKLFYENDFWQVLETSNGKFKLFNAFYDERNFFKDQNNSAIKIIAMVDRVEITIPSFCQLWFDDFQEPVISKVVDWHLMWAPMWGNNPNGSPYLITCFNPLTFYDLIPTSVSLVETECDKASNEMKIINNFPRNEEKKMIGICSKLFKYPGDDSMMLIEWIEIQLSLGIEKIVFHVIEIHPNMMKVLRFYELRERVKIEMFSLPRDVEPIEQNLLQGIQTEMIQMNDCFYKNINEFSFLV